MPKQISNKVINNSSFKQNLEKSRDSLLYPDKQKRDLSEGNSTYYSNNNYNNVQNQKVNIIKSSSKKNININNTQNNNSNQINTNVLLIQDNLKVKKVDTMSGASCVSTPVFNKEKEKDKSNEKDRIK